MPRPFKLPLCDFGQVRQIILKAAGKVAAIGHRHEDIYPPRPFVPLLSDEAGALHRILEHGR